MKALSIRQPWVWAILCAGKTVENRDWSATGPNLVVARRLVGQTIALHASAGMTRQELYDASVWMDTIGVRAPGINGLTRGGIVGTARLLDIIHKNEDGAYPGRPLLAEAFRSPWFFGPLGLVLTEVKPVQFSRIKGALGFFDVPDMLVREAA